MANRYMVTGHITISVCTEVEADSAREAERVARDRPVMSLCAQCAAGEPEHEWVTSGELDGSVRSIRAEDTDG